MTSPTEFGLQSALASVPGVNLSLGELLASLRRRCLFQPMLLEALTEKAVRRAAEQAGLTVSAAELQQAANRFRLQQGLRTAADTYAWLQRNQLRPADLEAMLEQALLSEKFRNHLVQSRLQAHFAADPERFTRARISHLTAAAEGLARELLARVQDEGADFGELAQQHQPGGTVVAMRPELPVRVAEMIFHARPNSVVGPEPSPQGWQLFLVHEFLPPQLDPVTTARIRQELFDDWLRDRLAEVRLEWSGLDES